MSLMGTKKTLVDVWPVKNKRFLVLVDPDNLDEESGKGLCSAIPTIQTICSGGGKAIVVTSFGRFTGIDVRTPSHNRQAALESWRVEGGLGLSHFFASLDGKKKLEVLNRVEDHWTGHSTDTSSTYTVHQGCGKTKSFSSLSREEKLSALKEVFPQHKFKNLSSFPLVETLEKHVGSARLVKFVEDCLDATDAIKQMRPSDVLVLENLRFYSNETSTNYDERHMMGSILASYCDIFVNDSFPTAYRELASNEIVPKLLRHGCAGFVMDRELTYFRKLVTHPQRPTCVVIGGYRLLLDKLTLLRSLLRKVDKVLLAGGVALPFIAAKGKSPGLGYDPTIQIRWNSYDKEAISIKAFARRVLEEAETLGVPIILPLDFVTHDRIQPTNDPEIWEGGGVPRDMYAVDVGPNTIAQFAKEIRNCRTVFWAGTLGYASNGFKVGTESFSQILASSNVISVVGGGHTADCVNKAGCTMNISHICSGSISQMNVLQGIVLPGVAALTDVHMTTATSSASAINEMLRHLPLFANCSAAQLMAISMKAVRRVHNAGDFLIYDGDRTTSMHVVAKGSLCATPNACFGKSVAQRYIGRGHAVGQYEFIAQRPALETVFVVDPDTVTFQLTASALQEAIGEHNDLATQLVINLADPLRLQQRRTHETMSRESDCIWEECSKMRKPIPIRHHNNSSRGSLIGNAKIQTLQTLISTSLLFKYFSPEFAPFKAQRGTCIIAQYSNGLLMKLFHDAVREVTCRNMAAAPCTGLGDTPQNRAVFSSFASAVAATPLKLASTGVPFHEMTFFTVLDNALINGLMSLAPFFSHALFVHCRSAAQVASYKGKGSGKRPVQTLPLANEVFISMVCRCAIGLFFYPLVIRRNPQCFSLRSFLLYLLKQCLSLVVEMVASRTMKPVAAILPF